MRHIAIIGNGISGITAARHLRKGSDDRITVISAETEHFYSRTALMYIYMGQLEYHHTKPYEDHFWPKNRIELLRAEVNRIDFNGKEIFFAPSGNASSLKYDILILALGSRPNFADWPGAQLRGVQGLYGMPDLERMEADTKGVREAVVVGGGLIGVELCEMLQARGIAVTFLVREESYWRSVLPKEESDLVSRHIREHGIDLRLGAELAELVDDGSGRVGAVRTKGGETLPAQFVGISIGVQPNIAWLKESPLETSRGILVNEYLETSLPDVYAIGDCVEHRNPPPGRRPVEQIWYSGRIMGETLARTLLGERTAYRPGVFFNSAKFFSIEYQTYGEVPANLPSGQQTFYWEHPEGRKALRINYRSANGAVTGVNALGIRQRQEVWEGWITDQTAITEVLTQLGDANFDPEFFPRHENEIIAQFNRENPQRTLKPRRKAGLLGWLR